jgi:predicted ATPase
VSDSFWISDLQRLSFLLTGRHGSGNLNLLAIAPEQGIVVTLEPEHAAARREKEMSVYRKSRNLQR